ncbi:(3R)-3-hydroxyacyl-CoA dehydrogenase isoform X2 [Microcaecilia unicolor]|uniref:Estradiol 17-beta-dehydrogenase 8 isoform X2 n=1 Tax=Microcaecilia unicolor TaxID=1415580 RepID=A0A6P7XKQ2_9AMPH|nr:estradiol 17-beta-dehydrogenase 8 isoform X2 [Microcaecilia unicolor]
MAAPLRLLQRLAVVTGGSSGIGRAVAQRLAKEGAAIAVVDLNESAANETVQMLSCDHSGQKHVAFVADISSSESVERLMSQIQSCFSYPPSISVNSAGITRDEFLLRLTEEAFDTVLKVNLKVGNLGQINYAASKAGVEALTKTAAKELARYGIRCNTVLPGFIDTPMTQKVPQKVLDKFTGMIPLERLGDPTDVADVCAFLASDDSSYITGASIEVTGGIFL